MPSISTLAGIHPPRCEMFSREGHQSPLFQLSVVGNSIQIIFMWDPVPDSSNRTFTCLTCYPCHGEPMRSNNKRQLADRTSFAFVYTSELKLFEMNQAFFPSGNQPPIPGRPHLEQQGQELPLHALPLC